MVDPIAEEPDSTVPTEEALKAVEAALARLAILHLAFSKTLVDEFGEKKGKDLIAKAIIEYGTLIVERLQKGRPDLTQFGLCEESGQYEDGRHFVRGCTLGKVFKEHDALDPGYLYCYVDASRMMALHPDTKIVHPTCEACGDDDCTFDRIPTTEEEREAFSKRTGKWREVDPRLREYG